MTTPKSNLWLGASTIGLTLCLGLVTATPVKAANLIKNGSFEAQLPQVGSSGSGIFGSFQRFNAPNTSIPDWNLTSGSVEVFWSFGSDGNQSVDVTGLHTAIGQGPGTLEQSFSTQAGTEYNVSFDMSGAGDPTTKEMLVSIVDGSNTVFSQIFAFDVNSVPVGTFVTNTFSFIAPSASSTIAFTSLVDSTFDGPYLDNVIVETVPTPALLPGLISMGAAAIRKRRQESAR